MGGIAPGWGEFPWFEDAESNWSEPLSTLAVFYFVNQPGGWRKSSLVVRGTRLDGQASHLQLKEVLMSADNLRYPSVHQDFNEVLLEQLQRTPWILISGAFHAALVVLMMLFMSPQIDLEPDEMAEIGADYVDETEEDVPEVDPPEDDPVPTEVPVEDLPEVTQEVVNETPDNSDMEETFGESEFEAPARLTSTSNSDAIGLGGGVGGGSGAGGRNGRIKGGGRPKAADVCVMRGLEWLSRHQSPNGSWDADGFCCATGGCTCLQGSKGGALFDTGVTGLSLLAFLGAGESPKVGEYRRNVARAVRWLMKSQDAEGCYGESSGSKMAYNQAIATLAMIEAYDMSRIPSLKASAEKGLAFCMSMQNPYKAWRYGVATGQNDVSVTGWMVMVMKAAKSAKLPFDERRMAWATDYIVEMTDEESGRVGYVRAGEPTVREAGKTEEFPAEESESMTAVGICSRIFMGEDPSNSKEIKLATENLLLKKMPVWDQSRGSIDMYYWYYGTLAMYQVGGQAWKKWNVALKDAVIDRQRVDGVASGSWDPRGAWGEAGGRVYSTALMTMCLEVYYRYGRVFGTK
ncbi:MAG: hypothetical protein ACI97A_000494 [Planctomycetota bacterium]|jgi:hypothetical protein